jgi:hypothetical protein
MKYLKLFEQYNSILETSSNREEFIKKYGKYLFGEQFGDSEDNTNLENELVKLIKDFTRDNFGERQDPAFATKLKELSNYLDVFPSVLKPLDKLVFRGTSINFRDIIKFPIEYGMNKNGNYTAFISNFVYKPKSVVSSWTTNWKKSSQFSGKDSLWSNTNIIFKDYIFGDPNTIDRKEPIHIENENNIPEGLLNAKIPVIMECDKLDTFLFNSEKFNKLSSAYTDEFEILKINNDPINIKLNFHTSYNEKYKKFVILSSITENIETKNKKEDDNIDKIELFSLEKLNNYHDKK